MCVFNFISKLKLIVRGKTIRTNRNYAVTFFFFQMTHEVKKNLPHYIFNYFTARSFIFN